MDSGARGFRQLACSLEAMVGCTRLVKPSRVFSKAASRATPFWEMTLPEWRCDTVGKSRFFRNTRASRIWRPMRWICCRGSPLPLLPYLWHQSSFQQFRSICKAFCAKIFTVFSSTTFCRFVQILLSIIVANFFFVTLLEGCTTVLRHLVHSEF